MIPGDIGTELASILRGAAAAGQLPQAAAEMTAAGTWRPAPAGAGGGPGTYATALPFTLAQLTGGDAAGLAGLLAARLREAAGIRSVSVTGGGYLTVTVTAAALAGLAARVVAAGPGCAASDALRGTALPAPCCPDLASAASWEQAWRWSAAEITCRLAARAGAQITVRTQAKRAPPPGPAPLSGSGRGQSAGPPPHPGLSPDPLPGQSPVAAAIEFAGPDAVRYTLARTAPGRAEEMSGRVPASHGPDSRFRAVLFAHADAASTLRWAADLGLRRVQADWTAEGLLPHPHERLLLAALSWLPERVAGAARRRRPHELAIFLEHLAGTWLDCRESCPALPFGGLAAPPDEAGAAARLWLADAARTALAAGLSLLGVSAPERV